MQYRQGESSGTFFRFDRFYRIGEDWYFSTRENLQVGPFSHRDDAEAELMIFLRHTGEGGLYNDCHTLLHSRR